jgi:hypothetical protein
MLIPNTDLALTFVDSCTLAAEGLEVPAKDLWEAYQEWSRQSGLRYLKRNDFLCRLSVYFKVIKNPNRVLGLMLKDTEDWEWFSISALQRVYLISNGTYTKIGVSLDPKTRCDILQVGSAEKLTLLYSWPGGYEQESELHRRYAHKCIRGEWFDLTADDISLLAQLANFL